MRISSLVMVVVLIFFGGSEIRASDYVPGELLVKYKPGLYPQGLDSNLGRIGWAVIKTGGTMGIRRLIADLEEDYRIAHVEFNYYGKFLSEPNDPDFNRQWYLPDIEAPGAWDKSLGKDVIIGLVDSGVELTHQDLAGNILPDGKDFGDDDDDPTDEYGHGTQVCGVIAAIQDNDLGISGIAPESKILPLKVSVENTGTFTASAVAEAIIYASDRGARIINISLALAEDPQVVRDAVDYAATKGVLLVAAAGQDVGGPVLFPASLEKIIAVSATDEDSGFWFKSNKGPEIELSAPGKDIYTTQRGGGYTTRSGTSLSAPMVSAVAALLIAHCPGLTRDQIKERLIVGADDLGDEGKDDLYGYGKVNALNTVSSQPCLAEEIYGEYSEEVELLRNFRDNRLNKTSEGQEIVRLYYEWGPVMIKVIKENEEFKEKIKGIIDEVLTLIGAE